MQLLLDTCTLLWLTSEQKCLSERARDAIQQHPDDLFVSAISALECATKAAKKKLRLPYPETDRWFRESLKKHGISQVPINFQIASHAGDLPLLHKDPYDRLIIATAWEYHMTIVTSDQVIHQYPDIECLW